jgi:lytic cellulose monooxygenase (C1-hydroxylating)
MKYSILALLALSALGQAHTIAQRVKIGGVDQGQLVGIRAPNSNNPITNTGDSNIACNSGYHSPVSSTILNVTAGQDVAVWWQHV